MKKMKRILNSIVRAIFVIIIIAGCLVGAYFAIKWSWNWCEPGKGAVGILGWILFVNVLPILGAVLVGGWYAIILGLGQLLGVFDDN